jgi:hypothetical protein
MAETTESDIFDNELIQIDSPIELQKLAKQKAGRIMQKINNAQLKIKEAKDAADEANKMKSGWGWWGSTAKKTDAISKATVMTNTAVAETNDLIQESIRLTCTSIQFAQVMHKTMAYMMVNGFKDEDGRVTQLSKDGREMAHEILYQAEDFVKKQLAVEMKQAEMQRQLNEKDKMDEEQNKRINIFYRAFRKIKKSFADKSKTDSEQYEKHEKEIRLLFEYAKQQSNNIQKITDELKTSVIRVKVTFVISVVALVVSVVIMVFVK